MENKKSYNKYIRETEIKMKKCSLNNKKCDGCERRDTIIKSLLDAMKKEKVNSS
tara:strand:- start:228 stop:389 length:162 start_codon:yes stop_codon:yes gene_type:complete